MVDRSVRQLTARAVITGMILGGVLSLCNIYSGLKIGWSNNMSVTAVLIGYSLWRALAPIIGGGAFTIYETNITQTAASSAASISSAGLVAAVPALAIFTGENLAWPLLALWTFSVCLVGITVATGLRKQMLEVDALPFPSGIATAETLKEVYAAGQEAVARVWVLVASGVAAAGLKVSEHVATIPKWTFPGSFATTQGNVTLGNLTFAFEPSLLMLGVGALVGLRAGLSMLLGALLAWGILAPMAIDGGWAAIGKPDAMWFGPLNKWLLWPGVSMMVTASLTSFAFSAPKLIASMRAKKDDTDDGVDRGDVPRKWFLTGLIVALILSSILQNTLFGIAIHIAILGVFLSFLLAIVAARVSGETNVTPVGAMGKITQLMFGVLAPGNPAPNLMAANVTGGAASQCADLLHDLKSGMLIGATARYQAIAQVCGAAAGAAIGSAAYLVLIPDPANQLFTSEWPAPAVATWKAVAEIFAKGISAMPPMTPTAAIVGAVAGIVMALGEKLLPARHRRFMPSAAAIGLALVLPAYNSIHMCFGAILAWILTKYCTSWSERFLIVAASGLIAGEGLAGFGIALQGIFQ